MESFVEKFNMFDLFTMLIPGIVISALFSVSLSFRYYDLWKSYGNEKYVLFFIFSYVIGVIFQEIGTIIDKLFLHKLLYRGEPRKIFLQKDKCEKIFDIDLSYEDANFVKESVVTFLGLQNRQSTDNKEQEEFNSYIFAHCLNIAELNGLTWKSDKMMVISEMSRSLFLGCFCTIILNLFMVFRFSYFFTFYYIEILILIVVSYIFLYRKMRYEKYRIRILIRNFLFYIKSQDSEKSLTERFREKQSS